MSRCLLFSPWKTILSRHYLFKNENSDDGRDSVIELCVLQLTGKEPEEFFPIENVDQWSPCSGVADTVFTTNLQLHFGFKRLLWPAWEADHHL